jgi:hypothetical protein
MKTAKRLTCFFLALIVLFTNTGFGLVEHSCMMRVKSTSIDSQRSIINKKGCCCQKDSTNTINNLQASIKKAPCCTEKDSYQNVDYPSSIISYVAKFLKSIVACIFSGIIFLVELLVQAIFSIVSSLITFSAPSVSGRGIIIFIQSFLI